MSNPLIDAVIFILIGLSISFAGIGMIGLFLFPDIRSRMHTAFRATLISLGCLWTSVIVFALFVVFSGIGGQYIIFVIHSVVLLIIVIIANAVLYKLFRERTKTTSACGQSDQQKIDNKEGK
jgi:multicomponent Na+:H+ antiporter subunit G